MLNIEHCLRKNIHALHVEGLSWEPSLVLIQTLSEIKLDIKWEELQPREL